MAKPKPRREGQITQVGPNKFKIRIFLGRDGKGKRHYTSRTIYGGQRVADRALRQLLTERDTGKLVPEAQQTVAEYLDSWLEVSAKPRVVFSTHKGYASMIQHHLKPELGRYQLAQLTPAAIQANYAGMIETGYSPATVRHAHAVLRSALNQAVKWGTLESSPATFVDLPRSDAAEMQALTPPQAVAFLDAAKLSPWHAFYHLLISTGARPSEALALTWADVDLTAERITISKAVGRDATGAVAFDTTKTRQGRRSVPLPGGLVPVMLQLMDRGQLGTADLVFPTFDGELLHSDNFPRRDFKRTLKRAGLSETIRLYDLRHTCATLLLLAGTNPKIVSERLGHSSVTLTLDTYSHVLPDMQQAAADRLDELLYALELIPGEAATAAAEALQN